MWAWLTAAAAAKDTLVLWLTRIEVRHRLSCRYTSLCCSEEHPGAEGVKVAPCIGPTSRDALLLFRGPTKPPTPKSETTSLVFDIFKNSNSKCNVKKKQKLDRMDALKPHCRSSETAKIRPCILFRHISFDVYFFDISN